MTIADYPTLKQAKREEIYNSVKKHLEGKNRNVFNSIKELTEALGGFNG